MCLWEHIARVVLLLVLSRICDGVSLSKLPSEGSNASIGAECF